MGLMDADINQVLLHDIEQSPLVRRVSADRKKNTVPA